MYFREVIFGQELEHPKAHTTASRLALLSSIAVLGGIAWHYGIITFLAVILRDSVVGIWKMLCDVAASIGNFLPYLQR